MKKYILNVILLCVILIACNSSTTVQNNWRTHSEDYNFTQYNGKTIKDIYHASNGGNYVIIEFTDGTKLQLFANKYVIDVEQ
jgi:hypothetical protein